MKCKYCGTKLKKGIEICHKCGRVNKTQFKMNAKRAVISGAAILITLVVAIGTIVAVTGSAKGMEARIIDEGAGEYLLVNTPADLVLDVKLKKGKTSRGIVVEDIYGDRVNTSAEVSSGILKINAPQDGYSKGEVYTIDLKGKGSFINQEFKDARKLIFIIEKQNTNIVEYKPGVKTLSDGKVHDDDGILSIDGEYSNGDIIVCNSDGQGVNEIYKLKNVKIKDGKTTAEYTEAVADEVYEKLDILYYDDVNLSKAKVNEEVVDEMVESSGIIEAFTDEAYAADDVKCKAEFDGKKNFKVTLTDPDDKNRQLVIEFEIADKMLFKCTKRVLMLDNTLTVGSGIEVSIKGAKEDATEDSIRKAIDDYTSAQNGKTTNSEDKNNLISIPAFSVGFAEVYIDLGTATSYKLSAQFNAGIDAETQFTQGFIFDLKKIKMTKKYADITGDIEAHMMAKGQLDAYAGIYMEAGIRVPAVANAGLRADGGPYIDSKGCFIVKGIPNDTKKDGYYKIDIGLRFAAGVAIDTCITKEKLYKLGKAQKPLKKYARYLELEGTSISDEYYNSDEGIYIGQLEAEYYDKIKEKELFKPIHNYTLYVDGDVTSLKDGVLDKDLKEGKHTFKLEWKYEGQKFEKKKEVQITEFDPWGQFYSVNVLGKTYGEIESEYGPLISEGYHSGGEFFTSPNLEFEIAFPILELRPENVSRESVRCSGMTGTMFQLFRIDKNYSYDELAELMGIDIQYQGYTNYDGDGHYYENYAFYYASIPDENGESGMYIRNAEDGYIGPDAVCDIRWWNEESGEYDE